MKKETDLERFQRYEAQFPFPTVVPRPPVSILEKCWALALYALHLSGWSVYYLCFPLLGCIHLVLLYLDRLQRRRWNEYYKSWPHHSVPHERPLKYPTNDEFPLTSWHLRCEDGRQRWYYGGPLAEKESGNELSEAMLHGYHSLESYRQNCFSSSRGVASLHRDPGLSTQPPTPLASHSSTRVLEEEKSGAEYQVSSMATTIPATNGDEPEPRTPTDKNTAAERSEQLSNMWERRRFVELYQIGLTEGQPRAGAASSSYASKAGSPRSGDALGESRYVPSDLDPAEAMRLGADFLTKLQDPFSGHWPNDYSGCMFLTPGVLIVKYIIAGGDVEKMFDAPFDGHRHLRNAEIGDPKPAEGEAREEEPCRCGAALRSELIRYLRNYQNEDGGFGQHTEGHSTMIGSVLSYVSLRLLGVPSQDSAVVACRQWIRREGGALWSPTWAKVWLCILGVYSWDGVQPISPELALLPSWCPFALSRSWCHSRVISIPFAYFYGKRYAAPATWEVTTQLREELYLEAYDSIQWSEFRSACCPKDLYTPPSSFFHLGCRVLRLWEKYGAPRFLRHIAIEECWKQMAYDDENTHFICLGPVNKSLNLLATYCREGSNSVRVQLHEERLYDYMYLNRAGMKMSGYNGSQLWDTSFAVQALVACGPEVMAEHVESLQLAHHYVDIAQVTEDPMCLERFYRHRTKGAWNFSTSDQGWQVSDCTAEGLRVLLLLSTLPFPTRRIFDGVDEILSLRNIGGDGGWASYEPTRAPAYAELMNASELFKDVMREYSYAECSSSCVHTLSLFRRQYPHYRSKDVNLAIREGIACILEKQNSDGSFYGSWAVCFTYGAWIVSSALSVSGELEPIAHHPKCQRLINFLVDHQLPDGGWGEDINSCVTCVWKDSPDGGQVVQTAWSVMAIMNACGPVHELPEPRRTIIRESVEKGVRFIISRQLKNGDWDQERISGVFNGNNPIHYPGYKNSMTVWALGEFNEWRQSYTASAYPSIQAVQSSQKGKEMKKLQ